MIVIAILLSALALYLSAYVAYSLFLFAANALMAEAPEREPAIHRRFNVLVPAHNEDLYLPRLLASLQAQEYPAESYRVTVVADNCADGTVEACRPFGVDVLERHDETRKGKGHAIRWALEQIGLEHADAFVILDADSLVNDGFLKHLNLQMERGDAVIQSYNGVANPRQSWFTRLMDVSETIANEIVQPGKAKLGLSSCLLGNGMCFDVRILRTYGWDAFSVGEDWEYYAKLVLHGEHVGYSRLARQYHQESMNLRQASSQRIRWSSGRFQVLTEYGPALVRRALRTRSVKALDACLPLVFPNLSLAMNLTAVGLVLSGLSALMTGGVGLFAWFGTLVAAQLVLFVIGVLHTNNRLENAVSLVLAPVFLAWKMGIDILSLCGIGRKEWKRTARVS